MRYPCRVGGPTASHWNENEPPELERVMLKLVKITLVAADLAMQAARRRDLPAAQAAFAALYEHPSRSLVAFIATRVGRSDVDDTHQAVWLKVWGSLPSRFDGRQFRGWLFQIARNEIIDRA